ncbi:beta galactosidase jelly roll domain-containing protein [Pirellulaceae bacterium]|nr:beta galactosidase jelly roll domain-containing protein [Pirellulaceae bacterium]
MTATSRIVFLRVDIDVDSGLRVRFLNGSAFRVEMWCLLFP